MRVPIRAELKSESKDSLQIENRPQDVSSIPESTQKTGKDDIADEIETKKEGSNSEKTNDTGGNTDFKRKKEARTITFCRGYSSSCCLWSLREG